jgi:hypothetical protein
MLRSKTRPTLPPSLRPERLSRMSLLCRFGWHQWLWGEVDPSRPHKQPKTCMKCGRRKIAWIDW